MRKFMRSNFYAFILAFALIAFSGVPAFAADSVEYVERSVDANGNVVSTTKSITSYIKLSSVTKEWQNSKWYYAYGKISMNSKVTVSGDVHLILKKAVRSLLQKVFMCGREAVSQFTVSLMETPERGSLSITQFFDDSFPDT